MVKNKLVNFDNFKSKNTKHLQNVLSVMESGVTYTCYMADILI